MPVISQYASIASDLAKSELYVNTIYLSPADTDHAFFPLKVFISHVTSTPLTVFVDFIKFARYLTVKVIIVVLDQKVYLFLPFRQIFKSMT